MAAPPLHRSRAEIDGEVARHVGELQEVVLHDLGLVAERHHEFLEAVGGVELHDVPENRMLADLDHRLGDPDCLLREPGAEAAGENDDLHAVPRNCIRSPAGWSSRSANISICRRVTAPTSSALRNARYQSAVQATASSNASSGRQPSTARARVASRVRSDASCGCSPSSMPPARTPAPIGGECLDEIRHRAEAVRVRGEIQGDRRAVGVGDHGLRQHQIAGERIEHVLPGPHGLRISQRHGFTRLEGRDDVGHDPERRPVPAADDVARPRRRDPARAAEEALPEGMSEDLGASLGAAIGIVTAEAVVLGERTAATLVLVDLVARHHERGAHARHRSAPPAARSRFPSHWWQRCRAGPHRRAAPVPAPPCG